MVNKNEEVADLILKKKLEQQALIKKNRRRKTIKKFLIFLTLFSITFFYFISDLSKIKYINVSNNVVVSKSEILEHLDINLDSRLIINNPVYIKYKLNKHPLINKSNASMNLFNRSLSIQVEEISMFGYRLNSEEAYLIMMDGSQVNLSKEFYIYLDKLIYIEGFIDDQVRLVESFEELDDNVINQISEIHQTEVSFDDKLLEIRMNDGNRVYTSFQTVERLNYYFDIIINLNSNNSCIFIDEMSGEAFSQPCDN